MTIRIFNKEHLKQIQPTHQTLLIILLIVVFSFILYRPALTTEYGMHEDYTLLTFDSHPMDFHLVRTFIMRGRIVGAVLLGILGATLDKISDLIVIRWFSLIFLLLFLGLLGRFLKQECRLNNFWLTVFCLSAVMLPCSQISVLRASIMTSTTLTMLFAAISYHLLYYTYQHDGRRHRAQRSWFSHGKAAIAMILFLLTHFIYPNNALSVWIFTLAIVLFRPLKSWPATRRIFVRDVLFFGSGTVLYRLLDQKLVMPLVRTEFTFNQLLKFNDIYTMDIAWNPIAKLKLLGNTFLDSAAGHWHVLYHRQGAVVFFVLMGLGLIALVRTFIEYSNQTRQDKTMHYHFGELGNPGIQKIIVISLLLLLVNLPPLAASGVFGVLGYRTIIPMSIMMILIQIWFLYAFKIGCKTSGGKICATFLICIWLAAMSLVSCQHINDVVANYHKEMNIMRSAMTGFDPARHNSVIVVRAYAFRPFVDRDLIYEFRSGIQFHHHVKAFFWERFGRKLYYQEDKSVYTVDHDSEDLKQSNPRNYIINLNSDEFRKF